MNRHGVAYDRLYMRKAGDFRADYIVKEEMLAEMRADGYEPWLVFDDRQSVVDMWRANGLFVLQCAPHETNLDVFQFHKSYEFPLIIMVGPSGAGKTSFLEREGAMDSQCVISTDVLREAFTGDAANQEENLRVFNSMYELAKTRLKLGLPTILDATHVKTKDRVKAATLVGDKVPVMYIVIDRPLEEKLKTKEDRSEEVVRRHDNTFKSNLKAILNGDGLSHVKVLDLRTK